MTASRDEYHDPRAVGSLRGALHTWRTLGDARREALPFLGWYLTPYHIAGLLNGAEFLDVPALFLKQ